MGLWRFGSKDDPIYLATTDYPIPQRFNIDTLDSMEFLLPDDPQGTVTGCTHWQTELGTENHLIFQLKNKGIFSHNFVEVQRFTPDNRDYSKPEVIATFEPKKESLVHSFSVTENYAIFFYYPMVLESTQCLFMNNFHALECLKVLDEQTDIYVVNLKTGEVKEMKGQTWYSQHHINAYETEDGNEIVVDLSPSEPTGLRDLVMIDKMLYPPEISEGVSGSTCGEGNITRYQLNLNTGLVSSSTFPNPMNSRYMDKFDFPSINEAYRGKKVRIKHI